MAGRRGWERVPCSQCIQRASSPGTKTHELSLCNRCTTILRERNGVIADHRAATDLSSSGSLHQLNQLHQARTGRHATSHEVTVSNYWSKAPRAESSETVAQLKELCYLFVEAVNTRDFTHPVWTCCASDVQANKFDAYSPTSNLAENIRTFQLIAMNNPDYRISIESIDISFEDDGNMAHAYVEQAITGRPIGLRMNSLAVFTYARPTSYSRDWRLISFTSMRSSGPGL